MAGENTKIWVRIVRHGEKRLPIRVNVDQNAIMDQVVETSLVEVKLNNIARDLVTVKFEDAEVCHSAPVSNYTNTTASNPLLLQIEGEGT